MGNVKKILALIFYFIVTSGVHAAEQIDRYDVDATVRSDGTVAVVETIAYDFGTDERHGIFRTLPVIKTNEENKKFEVAVTGLEVSDPLGTSYTFVQSRDGDDLELKIGDPDKTITGKHTYIIRYTLGGALTYFEDHDEFYWNAFGTNWPTSISEGTFRVTLPENIPVEDVQMECFTGSYGASDVGCSGAYENGTVVFTLTSPLSAYEGLTAVVGFPKGMVAVLEPQEVISFWSTQIGKIVLVVLAIIGFLWYVVAPFLVVRYWWKNGRDPKPAMGVTSAWFSPPKNKQLRPLTPVETGGLVDEQVDLRDIYASIVDLARRGYIKIVEKDKKFTLEKVKDWKGDGELEPFEVELLDGLMGSKESVKFEDANLYETNRKVSGTVYESLVKQGFFPSNPQTIRNGAYLVAVIGLFTFNLFLGVIAFIFGKNLPRKTPFGAQGAAIGMSLKNFLSSQERHMKFQAKNQMFFEKLLPYAIAFGVEDVWAKRFADIKMTSPDWYESSSGRFNSVAFVNSLDRGYSSGFTPRSTGTSSSGFRSGFSSGGGGFSGGGGGGGGGGSW